VRYFRLFGVFIRTSIQTDMEYRTDFFARIVASLLGMVTTLGGLTVVFQYTSQIRGWSLPQVVVLLAVYYLLNGLIEMFIAPNMRQIMEQVRQGTLDFVLLKPVSAQFLATFRQVNIWRSVNVLLGIGLAVYSIRKLALHVGPVQAAAFALTLGAGLLVVYSFWLLLVTLTFWVTRIDNLEQVMWQAFEAGRYPIDIYPAWLRGGLTYVIPVAFIITVPAEALSGRGDPLNVPVALLVGLIMLTISALFWRFGLKHYTGASA
jgi:ABC-2 type transport system permease protein